MTPVENVLSRCNGVRESGNGWVACCPAHDDRNPSLSISEGRDGRVLLHCHAGCPVEAVCQELGLRVADLMPVNGNGRFHSSGSGTPPSSVRPDDASRSPVFQTWDAAIDWLVRRYGEWSDDWVYHDDQGESVGAVLRWDRPDGGKDIRPLSLHADGWRIAAMPEPRPLYRLPDILKADPTTPVVVCEGEKAADAARKCGLLATTSSDGAKAAHKTDWTPLRGRTVIILPDNDEPGEAYAADVARLVTAAGAADVKILRLADYAPDLPEGGDLADIVGDERWCGLPLGDGAEPGDLGRWILDTTTEPWRPESQNDNPVKTSELKDDPVQTRKSHSNGNGFLHSNSRPRSQADVAAAKEAAPGWTPEAKPTSGPVLICTADDEPRGVSWLWPGRIPLGCITLLVGLPGEGKSFLTTDVAARITTGTPWPDGSACPQGSVILISAEDDPAHTIRPRLDAHYADVRKVYRLPAVRRVDEKGVYERMLTLADVDAIEAALKQLPDCKLIVVDPIGSYLGGRVDAHRDNEVRAVLAPIAKLAEKYGPAVLVVAHRRKSPGTIADDLALGSRAFTGISRAVWHLTRDPADKKRRLLLPGKNNLAPEEHGLAFRIIGEPPRLAWERGPVRMSADDALGIEEARRSKPGPDAETLNAASVWLRSALANGPRKAKDLLDEWCNGQDGSGATLKRAKRSLSIEAYRPEVPGPWWWRLPSKGIKLSEDEELEHLDPLAKNPENSTIFPVVESKGIKLEELEPLGPEPPPSPKLPDGDRERSATGGDDAGLPEDAGSEPPPSRGPLTLHELGQAEADAVRRWQGRRRSPKRSDAEVNAMLAAEAASDRDNGEVPI